MKIQGVGNQDETPNEEVVEVRIFLTSKTSEKGYIKVLSTILYRRW